MKHTMMSPSLKVGNVGKTLHRFINGPLSMARQMTGLDTQYS